MFRRTSNFVSIGGNPPYFRLTPAISSALNLRALDACPDGGRVGAHERVMESMILKRNSIPNDFRGAVIAAHKRFAKDEDGAVLVFALVLFLVMVMMGGLAVDLMRYETTRTSLQNTLDRSTLAAASLSQTLNPEAVVRDYFAKAGLTQDLKSVTVSEGLNFRNVNARALADTKPIFLHMIGINTLNAPGVSTAEQRITNVEIALVLDVSGSMQGTKITNLKSAAKEFVNTVLLSDGDDRISIGLVPYNGQVNLGPTIAPLYNVTLPTGIAGTACVDLPSSVYTTTSMDRNLALPTTTYADTYSSMSGVGGNSQTVPSTTTYVAPSSNAPVAGNRWCGPQTPTTANIMRPPINSITLLQSYIDGMVATGATSINAGLKWGLTLLDPGSRSVFSDLAGAGAIPTKFAVRPFEYTDPEALKVIVLMTDGEHFAEERMNTDYKDGMSPIYKATDGYYSIQHTGTRPSGAGTKTFYVPHLCTSSKCIDGSDVSSAWSATKWSNGTQLPWKQVWTDLRVSYVAWQLYARALGTSTSTRSSLYTTWMTNFRALTPTTTMDTQLQTICSQAKSKANVLIYGIAFDAPTFGQQMISQCSSGASYFFISSPTTIKDAFRTIATNISQLRLTQ